MIRSKISCLSGSCMNSTLLDLIVRDDLQYLKPHVLDYKTNTVKHTYVQDIICICNAETDAKSVRSSHQSGYFDRS